MWESDQEGTCLQLNAKKLHTLIFLVFSTANFVRIEGTLFTPSRGIQSIRVYGDSLMLSEKCFSGACGFLPKCSHRLEKSNK